MKKLAVIVIFLAVLFVAGCGLPTTPPAYIKDVVAYKEGPDGLLIYFALSDSSGNETTCDGDVTLTIVGEPFGEPATELYRSDFSIKESDFQRVEVGMGAFKRKRIVYSVGRLVYSSFTEDPHDVSGKVVIEFKPRSGNILSGYDTVFF